MAPFIWRDRLVKLEEGNFLLSAKGNHDDWDFSRGGDDGAVAGNPGEKIRDIQVVDENRLRFCCGNHDYILTGDDFYNSAFISIESPRRAW